MENKSLEIALDALRKNAYQLGQESMRERAAKTAVKFGRAGGKLIADAIRELPIEDGE